MTTNNNQMMNPMMADFTAMQVSGRALNRASKTIRAAQQAADELAGLNTMRGGAKGFKGFVGESMEAFESNAVGRSTQVLNNNGPADLLHTKANGETTLKQMKIGYKPKQIDFNKYRGQTVVVDADNPNFAAIKAEGAKCGVKVVKGHVTEAEAKGWAEAMQLESKITGSKNAVLVPKAYEGLQVAKAAHAAGMRAASVGAKSGQASALATTSSRSPRATRRSAKRPNPSSSTRPRPAPSATARAQRQASSGAPKPARLHSVSSALLARPSQKPPSSALLLAR